MSPKKLQSIEGFVSSYNMTTGQGYIRPHDHKDARMFPFTTGDFDGKKFRAHFTVLSSGGERRGGSSDVRIYLNGNTLAFIDEVLRY